METFPYFRQNFNGSAQHKEVEEDKDEEDGEKQVKSVLAQTKVQETQKSSWWSSSYTEGGHERERDPDDRATIIPLFTKV